MYDPNDLKELTSDIMYTERVIRKPRKVVRYYFENGYGASVACHEGSYGGPDGLYEMALLKGDNLHYEQSGIWSDVIGYLTFAEVWAYMKEIAEYQAQSPVKLVAHKWLQSDHFCVYNTNISSKQI